MHQVRVTAQQTLALAQGLTHQPDLGMLQVAQAAVNNSGGAAGRTRSEVVLLKQKRAPSGASAFAVMFCLAKYIASQCVNPISPALDAA